MKKIYTLLTFLTCFYAGLSAATITAVQNGSSASNSTWDLNRTPINNDIVIIPVGITVYIQSTPFSKNPPSSRPTLFIKIYGILDFSDPGNDKLYLGAGSTVDIFSGGKIQTVGSSTETIAIYNGSSDNIVWNGSPSVINGPAYANETSLGFLNGVLPLNLISFEANASGKGFGKLSWITSEESNTSHFEIEFFESRNLAWIRKGYVNAAGNSSSALHYTFVVQLSQDKNQFRLKQVDIDGKFTYSSVISIDYITKVEPGLYYSQKAGLLQFEGLNLIENNKITVLVFDYSGRQILKDQITFVNMPLYFSPVATGSYVVQLKGSRGILLTKKIMVY